MPRTLPAALTTAMDAGVFNAYLRVVLIDASNVEYELKPLYFKLEDTTAVVHVQQYSYADIAYFRIVRGAIINGTAVTVTSSIFNIIKRKTTATHEILEGDIVLHDYATVIANSTYNFVLEQMLASGHSITYEGTPAWRNYQFYKTGQVIIFSTKNKIYNVIKQKYLLFAVENGETAFVNAILVFCATDARTKDYDIEDPLVEVGYEQKNRSLISKDENNVVTTVGGSSTIHNLGFIRAADSKPTNTQNTYIGTRSTKTRIHLKRQTGDAVVFKRNGTAVTNTIRIQVTEIFDPNTDPSWYQIIQTLEHFTGGEGGAVAETVEKNTMYMPLSTGAFTGVLSSTDNNIQTAMDTIDDHDHNGLATTEGIQDIIGAMVSSNTETGIVVTYDDTNGKLDFVAEVTQAEFDDHLNDTTSVHAYTSLSSRPIAETNTNWIYGATSPGGTSAFVGTINGTPSGTSVVYNVSSGTEGSMKPSATTHLAKMRLYNTTRGTSALISDVNTGTNTITLTATVPAAWANGDTISIASQTVTGAPISYCDFEITSGPTNKLYLFVNMIIISTTVGDNMRYHPLETYGSGKQKTAVATVASQNGVNYGLLKITSNVFSMGWTGTPSNIILTEDGYLE